MRLYKMELYKLLHRKIVIFLSVIMLLWMGVYFVAEIIGSERTTLEDETYYGFQAIEIDRQIAKEYEGVLTDESVRDIIKTYGLPTEMIQNIGWNPINYVTRFITEHLTNAYAYNWEEYQLPTEVYSIADSALKEFYHNGQVDFGYAEGWDKFFEFSNMGLEMIFVWLIIVIAPIFCEERQQKTYPLIVTTELGRSTAITAKIAAAFTLANILYFLFMIVVVILFQGVYGILDVDMPTGVVLGYDAFWTVANKTILEFFAINLFTFWVAIMMLTAISLWVSAKVKTVFLSILISLFIFIVPVILQAMVGNPLVYIFASGQPALLVNCGAMIETWRVYIPHILFACMVIGLGCILGSRDFKQVDVC